MRRQVVIGSAFVAKYPNGGGNYWVPLQYLRGFRDLGCDAWWLEVVEGSGDTGVDAMFIETFLQRAAELNIAAWTTLAFYPSGVKNPDDRHLYGEAGDLDVLSRDALLLNLVGSLNSALRQPFARSILFDLDPGLFQIWASQWHMGVGEHDLHLTIGMHLGQPDCPIPTCGVEWHKVWPSVHLPSWPMSSTPGRAYTTVTQWWSPESALLGDEVYECSKRPSFVQVLDLPRHTKARLELAANIHQSEESERELFISHGWGLVSPEAELDTPQQYQRYIQASRGEFGCAKPAYVKGRTGWLSDRSVCYLASGRPCILQDTAASHHIAPSNGLQFFSTLDEAAACLARAESDYPQACRDARRIAEEVFATDVQLPKILALAGM